MLSGTGSIQCDGLRVAGLCTPKQAFQETGNGSCQALKAWTQNSWHHITCATVLYKQPRFKGREFCSTYIFNDFIYLFIYLCLCWVFTAARRPFSTWGKWGSSLTEVCGILILVASLVVERGLQASGVVAHKVSCLSACGIFLDQGSKPCPTLQCGSLNTGPPGSSPLWLSGRRDPKFAAMFNLSHSVPCLTGRDMM